MNFAPPPSDSRPETAPTPSPKVEEWKRRLLDLSARNRLLHFRTTKCTIELGEQPLAALAARLEKSELRFDALRPEREDEAGDARPLARAAAIQRGVLECEHPKEELPERLLATWRAARTELSETGTSTLTCILGFVRWADEDPQGPARRAPLLLLPIELERTLSTHRFHMRWRDADARLNETLVEKLRRDFSIDLSSVSALPETEEGPLDIPHFLAQVRTQISSDPRLSLEETSAVGFLSFSRFLLWHDLVEREATLLDQPLLAHLVRGTPHPSLEPRFKSKTSLRQSRPWTAWPLVLDADGSQLTAIEAALSGQSFVLQGPPGTGKSQTITNLIAAFLAEGKTVLFVAEKQAALQVVAERLRRVGLGDACLELHSTKASKRELATELVRVLDLPLVQDRPKLGGKRDLDELVRGLETSAEALHQPFPLGTSVFEFGHEASPAAASQFTMEFDSILETTRDLHERRLVGLRELAAQAKDQGDLALHPLRDCRRTEWSPLIESQLRTALAGHLGALRDWSSAHVRAAILLGISPERAAGATDRVCELLRLLPGRVPGEFANLDPNVVDTRLAQSLEAWHERAEELDRLGSTLAPWLRGSALDLDLASLLREAEGAAEKAFPLKWWKERSLWKALGSALLSGKPPALPLSELLRLAQRWQSLLRGPNSALAAAPSGLAATVRESLNLAPARILELAQWAHRFAAVAGHGGAVSLIPAAWPGASEAEAAGVAHALAVASEQVVSSGLRIADLLQLPPHHPLRHQRARGVVPAETLQAWQAGLPRLRAWARFIQAESALHGTGMESLLAALHSGRVEADSLVAAYETDFRRQWLSTAIDSLPTLRGFHGPEHQRRLSEFREGDREWIAAGGEQVSHAVAKRRPTANHPDLPQSELKVLRHEAKKKVRHWPIRRLLSATTQTWPRLKPCLLMSPLSVAEFLPAGEFQADLVVFDEASQVPTHVAVGAIARGRQVVIVGDSQQLPPTDFFDKKLDDEDEVAEESGVLPDLESILTTAEAELVPSWRLQWHYRSRHEDLIAFSNRHFYGGELVTFPSPHSGGSDRGLSLRRIEGDYGGSTTRTNPKEAAAVVEWIVATLRDPAQRSRSIGVVTFNQPQQVLIEDLLDHAREQFPEIEPAFAPTHSHPLFVKNLENVQGDERDIMLFSVTYGPDSSGRLRQHFGPLNNEGGEKRLNVAITRAREQLIVFTSIPPGALNPDRMQARGARLLAEFLQFAESAGAERAPLDPQAAPGSSESPSLASRIADALKSRGYTVQCGLGASNLRIDVAVRSPQEPARWILGILTDAPSALPTANLRDHERLRIEVLQRLGWELHQAWSPDWWHDADAEIRCIVDKLESLTAAP